MSYCDDCGCRMSNGICSGCTEELYILENQAEFIDFQPSDEFMEAAGLQARRRDDRDARKAEERNG